VRLAFGRPLFAHCLDCGATVACATWHEHVCDRERLVEHQMNGLEDETDAYLASPRGRLELWWATLERRSSTR
jgi:hypothetical protein